MGASFLLVRAAAVHNFFIGLSVVRVYCIYEWLFSLDFPHHVLLSLNTSRLLCLGVVVLPHLVQFIHLRFAQRTLHDPEVAG